MQYEIEGKTLPVVKMYMDTGDTVISQAGGRTWMLGPIETKTKTTGVKRFFTRAVTRESLFLSFYHAHGPSEIAFASTYPGSIIALRLGAGESIVAQKTAFLAATLGIELSIFFQKKIGTALFGGEGFIMQRITGPGLVFLEIDGHCAEYNLRPGEKIVMDTGYLAAMDSTCQIDVESVRGVKNVMFGKEGLFNTTVTGPGRIWIQTMPLEHLAYRLGPLIIPKK